MRDMTQGNIIKQLLMFMIPVYIGNIFQTFYNVVDTAIVGRYLGIDALAAVGSIGSLMFLVTGVIQGLTTGFGICISHAFGAKDEKLLKHYVAMSTFLCTVILIGFMVICIGGNTYILGIINIPKEILFMTDSYITIIYIGLPATMLYNILAAFARGLGDSRTPLFFLLISSVLNIFLDILFVGKCNIGIEGAALATIISQAVSGFLCYIYIFKRYPEIRFKKEDAIINIETCKYLLELGAPMALQYSIISVGGLMMQSALNQLGTLYISAVSVCTKTEKLLSQAYMALGVALATFTGQNYGADKLDRVKKGVKYAVGLGLVIVVIIMVITYFYAMEFVHLFITDPTQEMKNTVQQIFHIYLWFYPFHTLTVLLCNTFQGIGKGRISMYSGIAELIARFITAFILFPYYGFIATCLGGPLAWMFAAFLLIPYWLVYQHKLIYKGNRNIGY